MNIHGPEKQVVLVMHHNQSTIRVKVYMCVGLYRLYSFSSQYLEQPVAIKSISLSLFVWRLQCLLCAAVMESHIVVVSEEEGGSVHLTLSKCQRIPRPSFPNPGFVPVYVSARRVLVKDNEVNPLSGEASYCYQLHWVLVQWDYEGL